MAGTAAASEIFDPLLRGSVQFPEPHGNGMAADSFQRPGENKADKMRYVIIISHMLGTFRIICITIGEAFPEDTLFFPQVIAGGISSGEIPAEKVIEDIFQDHGKLARFRSSAVITVIDGNVAYMKHGKQRFQIISCLHIISSQP